MNIEPTKSRFFSASTFKLSARIEQGILVAPRGPRFAEYPDRDSYEKARDNTPHDPFRKEEFYHTEFRPERAKPLYALSIASLLVSAGAAGQYAMSSGPVSLAVGLTGLLAAGKFLARGIDWATSAQVVERTRTS
jgi:hypothetical protein